MSDSKVYIMKYVAILSNRSLSVAVWTQCLLSNGLSVRESMPWYSHWFAKAWVTLLLCYTTPCRLEFSWAMALFPWACNARRITGTKILLTVGYYSPDVTSQWTWIFSSTAVRTLNLAFLLDRQKRIAETENTEGLRFHWECGTNWTIVGVSAG
jgi:hypothetical protein